MAAAITAAVSLPSSKSSSLSSRNSAIFSDKTNFNKSYLYSKNVSIGGKVVPIRAQVTTEAPAKVEKVSKKDEEGVVVNKFKPKNPYIGRCLLNTKITGDDAPGETWHMVFSTEGELPYREGQSVGIIPDGIDKNGKPHKLRLYSIASSAIGDFGDSKTVSLCVKRLVYTNDAGEVVKGVCSNFLCDLRPGAEVKMTGPAGKEMLMPKDPNATVIMLATGTGIAPFRAFLWKMFFEKHENYKTHKEAKNVCGKIFPYYGDFAIIIGNDQATGDRCIASRDDDNVPMVEASESIHTDIGHREDVASGSTTSSRKRKRTCDNDDPEFAKAISSICKAFEQASAMSIRLKIFPWQEVEKAVRAVPGLTERQILKIMRKFNGNVELGTFFLGLTEKTKEGWVLAKLKDN